MGGSAGGRAARAVGAREAPGEATGVAASSDGGRRRRTGGSMGSFVPGLKVLRTYERRWLPRDAVAGLVLVALLVPQGMAYAKLGFIADLISKPTIVGYLNGLALTILVAQLPKLFGFSVEGDGFIPDLKGFVRGLAHGEAVAAAVIVGVLGIVVILGLQRTMP